MSKDDNGKQISWLDVIDKYPWWVRWMHENRMLLTFGIPIGMMVLSLKGNNFTPMNMLGALILVPVVFEAITLINCITFYNITQHRGQTVLACMWCENKKVLGDLLDGIFGEGASTFASLSALGPLGYGISKLFGGGDDC